MVSFIQAIVKCIIQFSLQLYVNQPCQLGQQPFFGVLIRPYYVFSFFLQLTVEQLTEEEEALQDMGFPCQPGCQLAF